MSSSAKPALLLDTRTRRVCFAYVAGRRTLTSIHRNVSAPEAILPLLEGFTRGRPKPSRVITVVGPGQFSYVRTGVVIGNTLAETWKVPVAAVRAGDERTPVSPETAAAAERVAQLTPYYGRAPSMTVR